MSSQSDWKHNPSYKLFSYSRWKLTGERGNFKMDVPLECNFVHITTRLRQWCWAPKSPLPCLSKQLARWLLCLQLQHRSEYIPGWPQETSSKRWALPKAILCPRAGYHEVRWKSDIGPLVPCSLNLTKLQILSHHLLLKLTKMTGLWLTLDLHQNCSLTYL